MTEIKINQENIIYYENQFIIGKSYHKSGIFDIHVFPHQDIETAIIPPFIKQILPYAFIECEKHKKVEFTNDSNLRLINN